MMVSSIDGEYNNNTSNDRRVIPSGALSGKSEEQKMKPSDLIPSLLGIRHPKPCNGSVALPACNCRTHETGYAMTILATGGEGILLSILAAGTRLLITSLVTRAGVERNILFALTI